MIKQTLWLAGICCALGAQAAPMTIAEQGSFAVGGTVKTSEGRYDANPAALTGNNNDFWNVYQASTQASGQTLHGGKATLVHLPKVGIKGNTHFPFSDLNNQQVAEHLTGWLKDQGLD